MRMRILGHWATRLAALALVAVAVTLGTGFMLTAQDFVWAAALAR